MPHAKYIISNTFRGRVAYRWPRLAAAASHENSATKFMRIISLRLILMRARKMAFSGYDTMAWRDGGGCRREFRDAREIGGQGR